MLLPSDTHSQNQTGEDIVRRLGRNRFNHIATVTWTILLTSGTNGKGRKSMLTYQELPDTVLRFIPGYFFLHQVG